MATGSHVYEEGESAPEAGFEQIAETLRRELAREQVPDGPKAVARIERDHGRWEREVAVPLQHNPRRPDAPTVQQVGKELTDQIVADARSLRKELDEAVASGRRTMRTRIDVTVAASAFAVTVFAIAALWYALSRAGAVARLEREHSLVEALQGTLRVAGRRLPHTALGSAYASATREALVGGDLLDVWQSGSASGWVLIADASGKGIEAARHAAFAQYAIRALAAQSPDPAEIVSRFNALFLETFDDPGVFVVLFLGAFDAASETLTYTSAGHPTALVRRGREIETLGPTGPIAGVMEGETYEAAQVALRTGEVLLLATDGLSEARSADGELFGDERIAALLRDGPDDPQAICDALVSAAELHSGGVQDDLAIVALRVVPEPGAVGPIELSVRQAEQGIAPGAPGPA